MKSSPPTAVVPTERSFCDGDHNQQPTLGFCYNPNRPYRGDETSLQSSFTFFLGESYGTPETFTVLPSAARESSSGASSDTTTSCCDPAAPAQCLRNFCEHLIECYSTSELDETETRTTIQCEWRTNDRGESHLHRDVTTFPDFRRIAMRPSVQEDFQTAGEIQIVELDLATAQRLVSEDIARRSWEDGPSASRVWQPYFTIKSTPGDMQ